MGQVGETQLSLCLMHNYVAPAPLRQVTSICGRSSHPPEWKRFRNPVKHAVVPNTKQAHMLL